MEILLLGVTVVSVLLAIILGVAAWRLSREERTRAGARVAALAAAANEPEAALPAVPVINHVSDPVPPGESRAAAGWPPSRGASFPASPRPAVRAEATDFMRPSFEGAHMSVTEPSEPLPTFGDSFLGSAVATPPSSGRQRGLAFAALALFAALVAGGYWTVFGGGAAATTVASSATAAPLELVSLRHERRAGRLAVTGLVRNPIAGAPVDKLAAVVFLFDQQGGFITSARADVDFLKLTPGDESPFVISLDAPATVARYRVSFRNDAGIVPHIDRRGQEPLAGGQVGAYAASAR
jgi:hypothetical protein